MYGMRVLLESGSGIQLPADEREDAPPGAPSVDDEDGNQSCRWCKGRAAEAAARSAGARLLAMVLDPPRLIEELRELAR
jgi:hypothetical protein